jgi:hypothetical protein
MLPPEGGVPKEPAQLVHALFPFLAMQRFVSRLGSIHYAGKLFFQ